MLRQLVAGCVASELPDIGFARRERGTHGQLRRFERESAEVSTGETGEQDVARLH